MVKKRRIFSVAVYAAVQKQERKETERRKTKDERENLQGGEGREGQGITGDCTREQKEKAHET